MKKVLLFFIFLLFIQVDANSKSLLIKPKQILDVRSGMLVNADILIESGVIVKVSKNIPVMSHYEIIDLQDMTILPGLMDAHVHLTGNTDLKGHEGISESSYLATIYGVKNAKQTLMAGFTTVRNVGASNYSDVALRDGIDQKAILGPTLLVSGPPLGITGGHCDSNILPAEYEYKAQGVADGPWEVRRKVRENKKYGADLIKYCATGGVMSKGTNVNNRQYTLDEMKAIVDEAHTLGMKVAAHAHGLEGIRMAIEAGVDSVEHSSLIDQETINLAIAKGVFLAMDIYVSDYILGEGAKNGIPEYSLNKERIVGKRQRENFKMAVESGAKMVFGTDAGIFPHGKNAKQFKYMVEWGMKPIEAIQASTINTAELFGKTNIGEIKETFDADLIGVKGNPLKDITLLENVGFIMKEGQVIK
ncbi:MAG: amidohydrolase family protein [Gammaproteobacteria bacterium]|nr:amidohydrolase family protein [Gammaproteobacteria bacterium]